MLLLPPPPAPARLRILTNRQNVRWMMDSQDYFGRFITPDTLVKQGGLEELATWHQWGADNGAWAGFKRDAFLRLLRAAMPYQERCLFIALPDVPAARWQGDPSEPMKRTFDLFDYWQPLVSGMGYPVALCLHPGATISTIPWERLDVIFVAGTDTWRYGNSSKKRKPITEVYSLIQHARQLGKHVHVGRMANSRLQLEMAAFWGAMTVDGTGETFGDLAFRRWAIPALRAINGAHGKQLALAI